MATESKVTVQQLMGVCDPTIAIIRVINQPYLKQFLVLSKKSTTKIQPNTYTVKVEVNTPKITPQSKIKVACSCNDFRYRQAKCFYDKGALLVPEDYLIKLDGQEINPDKTNPGCKNFRPCKHIKCALKYGLEHGI